MTSFDCPWWAQDIPSLYRFTHEDGGEVLDLRALPSADVPRIRSWLYQASREGGEWEIWLSARHPHIVEMVYAVAEDVRCVRGLRQIWIRREGEETSLLTREAMVYLGQHLAMDMYRPAEEVVIQLDPGVLSGHQGGSWSRM